MGKKIKVRFDPAQNVTVNIPILPLGDEIRIVSFAEATKEFHRFSALVGTVRDSNRVPSKAAGRKGTRRAWKRAHPPKKSLWEEFFQAPTSAGMEE